MNGELNLNIQTHIQPYQFINLPPKNKDLQAALQYHINIL